MPARKRVPRRKTLPVEFEETTLPPQYIKQSNGPSNLLIILLIVVSFFAGYLFFKLKSLEQTKTATTQPAQPAAVNVTKDQLKKLFTNDYIHFGNANSKLLFVEITDPSCPFCHIAGGDDPELSAQSGARFKYVSDGGTYVPPVPEMKKLVDDGKAAFVIIYSPGHGSGQLGMQALYCANEKGKFWETHNLLMSNVGYDMLNNKVQNDAKNISTLADFLAPAVDSQFLTSCLESQKYAKSLTRDEQVSQTLGFSGTPHFFVNTTPFKGAYSFTDMQSAVKAAL